MQKHKIYDTIISDLHSEDKMSDIKLFKYNPKVVELKAEGVLLERELQTVIEKNMQDFFIVPWGETGEFAEI